MAHFMGLRFLSCFSFAAVVKKYWLNFFFHHFDNVGQISHTHTHVHVFHLHILSHSLCFIISFSFICFNAILGACFIFIRSFFAYQ